MSISCQLCSQLFQSKTKLFKHLEKDHNYENKNRKPDKVFVLFGWLCKTTKEESKWIKDSDLNSLEIPWNAANNYIEHSLLEAIYSVDAGEELILTERPKGYSISSICSQRVCHTIGAEPSNHALCDVLSYQSKCRVQDVAGWIANINRRLESHGIQVLDRITIPSTSFDLNAETNCSQRVTECMLPLDLIMPVDLQIQPETPITRKGWTRNAEQMTSLSPMDSDFPAETEEGQVRIAFFRQLKKLLKKIAGRVTLHNYVTGGASPDDGPSNRRIDRFYHKEIVCLHDRLWVVFSISSDLFLKGQVARMVGVVLGVMRGWLPEDYIEESLRRDTIVEVPAVPGFTVYLAESKYSFYEANVPTEDRLDPRRRSIENESFIRLKQFRDALRDQVASQYENGLRDESGEFTWLRQFQQSCSLCTCRFNCLTKLRSRSPSQMQMAIPKLSPTPDVYLRCLELLRAADNSGHWPSSSSLRQRVIVDETLVEKGGKGGSFSVGSLPKPLPPPKGNALFPELMRACFELEQALCPNRPPSTTIAINRHAQFLPHRDSGAGSGQSNSLIVALGDFVGGEIVLDTVPHDIRYNALEFDGWFTRHWTLPFEGERYSLVWFTPVGTEPIDLTST